MINGNFVNFGFLHIRRNMHQTFSQIAFVRSYRSVQCASRSTWNIANSDSDIYYNRMRSFILCVHVPIEFIGIITLIPLQFTNVKIWQYLYFFICHKILDLQSYFSYYVNSMLCATKESNKVILKTIN